MKHKPQAPHLAKQEPALAAGLGTAIVTLILGLLVTHHVIGSAHVGDVQKFLDPLVAAALPAAGAWLIRHHVMPMSKIEAQIVAATHGTLTDADIARIGAAIFDHLELFDGTMLTGEAHPDAAAVGPPTHPTRQAGRPGADTL